MKLTKAQREALEVLASPEVRGRGGVCDGWKRMSSTGPGLPHINYLAAASLCEKGLARAIMPLHFNPFTHDFRYRITDAGREAIK